MEDIKAIFFDIDGTLVSFNTHKVPVSAINALRRLREKDIKTFIATGRMHSMIPLPPTMEFDGFIICNGALCLTPEGKAVFRNPLPQDDLERLAKALRRDRFPVAFMKKNRMTVNYVGERVEKMTALIDIPIPVIEEPEVSIREEIYQLCIFVDEQKEAQVLRDILKNCEANRWSDLFADINIRGNDKALGMDRMTAYYGIEAGHSMAFGDGGNDMAMLRHASIGVAMGNSKENVQYAADYVTNSVDDDGIAKALEHFGLI